MRGASRGWGALAIGGAVAVGAACGSSSGSGGGASFSFDSGTPTKVEAGHPRADTGADASSRDAGGVVSYGIDCPTATPSSLPASSPRVLILGPVSPDTAALAAHLQAMLGADPAFTSPEVVAQTIDQPAEAGSTLQGESLMYFFYSPSSRASRLAALSTPWTYVVLLEQPGFAVTYPELYFEGVRVLGCHARAVGAKPVVLMTWTNGVDDSATRGPIAYRVANGTDSVLSPAGYAWAAAAPDAGAVVGGDVFVAAATLYSTLTGRSAASTGYVPAGFAAAKANGMAATALRTVNAEAAAVHYQSPYQGVVQVETLPRGGAFAFLDWGTSSEALWEGDMSVILPKAGFTSAFQVTSPAAPEGSPWCGASCVSAVTPYLQKQQFDLMYARYYQQDAGVLQAAGPQKSLQVQVWDRHADGIPSDGVVAVQMMEWQLTTMSAQARTLGLALTPYHLMFSKLKTMVPAVQLTSDGTHATPTVAYGQATMSVVSRTGISTSTAGLDADTALCSKLADETVRQLSSLSVSGAFVPDDPTSRPTAR